MIYLYFVRIKIEHFIVLILIIIVYSSFLEFYHIIHGSLYYNYHTREYNLNKKAIVLVRDKAIAIVKGKGYHQQIGVLLCIILY